ncbi:hypothetical protein WN944_009945 [Citrus x changshan-huyou]|uniref:Uncharacterized protein n=1 Tax=Citrus x changshan-huyou TaxID=2935761 RepID=A0AAP0QWR8_9ROSI
MCSLPSVPIRSSLISELKELNAAIQTSSNIPIAELVQQERAVQQIPSASNPCVVLLRVQIICRPRVSRHISYKNHQQLHRSENKVLESFICCVFLFSRILSVSGDTLLPCEFPAIYSFGYSNSDTGSSSPAFTLFPAANAADRARDGGPIMDFPGLGSLLTFHLSCLTSQLRLTQAETSCQDRKTHAFDIRQIDLALGFVTMSLINLLQNYQASLADKLHLLTELPGVIS